jgi:hypothetical protein
MRQNKVLSLAIASALSMGAGSIASAGELAISYGTGSLVKDGAPTFASEYFFGGDKTVLDGSAGAGTADALSGTTNNYDDRYIYARYQFEFSLGEEDFLAKFALNNSAALGGTDGVGLGTGSTLDFVSKPSGTHAAATISGAFGAGGNEGDTQVTFLVQPDNTSSLSKGDELLFRFQLSDLEALKSPGEEIKLTVGIYNLGGQSLLDGAAVTETVAKSMKGCDIDLDTDSSSTVEIDVETGSINFIGSPKTPTSVALATLSIGSASGAIKADATDWACMTDDQKPNSATLTVVDGNFGASLTDPGKVFLDLDDDGIFDEDATPADIAATSLEADIATWELSSDQLVDIAGSASDAKIMIIADGTTEINDFSDPPQATFVIDYGSGNTDPYSKKLRHIKRNGTVCTLYNVPNPNATDEGNIRVTNTSGKEGKLLGTLRALDGTNIFTNKVLLETIGVNETVRLTPAELDAIEKDGGWLIDWEADTARNPTGSESGWPGRAVLTISSNLSSMEVFGLVRNKAGGPLTNMSVGGSGNGCD